VFTPSLYAVKRDPSQSCCWFWYALWSSSVNNKYKHWKNVYVRNDALLCQCDLAVTLYYDLEYYVCRVSDIRKIKNFLCVQFFVVFKVTPVSACDAFWIITRIRSSVISRTLHICSLGANHDGDGNSCRESDQYIMAASSSGTTGNNINLYRFSSCSVKSFRDYVKSLNRWDSWIGVRHYVSWAHTSFRMTDNCVCACMPYGI